MTPALAAPQLWFSARAMLDQLMHLIGAANAIALSRLTRKQRAEVFDWLKPLEAMVRKLLLIEAAALPPSNKPIARPRPVERSGSERPQHQPSFNVLPANARAPTHPARIRSLGAPFLVRDIWRERARQERIARLREAPPPAPNVRLANRIAALARVIARPLTHARRLARLLARKARAGEIARAIAFASLRTRETLFREADFDAAGRGAAATRFCDTS